MHESHVQKPIALRGGECSFLRLGPASWAFGSTGGATICLGFRVWGGFSPGFLQESLSCQERVLEFNIGV